MKIGLIGCGWLGLPLGVSLLKDGHEVIGSTTREEKLSSLSEVGINPVLLKVSSAYAVDYESEIFKTDLVVISIPPNRKSGGTDEYILQLQKIASALENGFVRHIVFISSTSIYPENNKVVTEEDFSPDSYLVKAENTFLKNPFKTTVIRFGGLFGPGRHPGKFLAGKVDVKGADNPVNMIHLYDCIGVIKTIISGGHWNEVFNACADDHPSRKMFYTHMANTLGLTSPQFSIDDHSDFKRISSEKLKQHTGYRFVVNDFLNWQE